MRHSKPEEFQTDTEIKTKQTPKQDNFIAPKF